MYYCYMADRAAPSNELENISVGLLTTEPMTLEVNSRENTFEQPTALPWRGETRLQLRDGTWLSIYHKKDQSQLHLPLDVCSDRYTGLRHTHMIYNLTDDADDVGVFA